MGKKSYSKYIYNSLKLGIETGNCEYVEKPIKLGHHKGNHFTIVIRNIKEKNQSENSNKSICDSNNEKIIKNLENFKEKGFLNYYGLQRFGTYRCPSHYLGKLLVEGNIKELVKQYLSPHNEMIDEKYNEALKMFIETEDPNKSLSVYLYLYIIYYRFYQTVKITTEKDSY